MRERLNDEDVIHMLNRNSLKGNNGPVTWNNLLMASHQALIKVISFNFFLIKILI